MIKCSNLTKRYGQSLAVDDLTFNVSGGEVTGFVGPNGAGKSTTMRMILSLVAPTAGTALINGNPYQDLRWPLREVGSVLDAKASHPRRSARTHLRALAASSAVPLPRADELLEYVGLGPAAERATGTFSLGMSQRLALACAMIGDPPVLILDEPLTGLDPEGVRWMRDLLRALAAEGRTVFVSSHLLSEMALTAERLIMIGAGRLLATTTVTDLVEKHSRHEVLVRSEGTDILRQALTAAGGRVRTELDASMIVTGLDATSIGKIALTQGVALQGLVARDATLEDAFLEATHSITVFRAGSSDKFLGPSQ